MVRLLGWGANSSEETGSSSSGKRRGVRRWTALTVTLVAAAGIGVVGYNTSASAQPKPTMDQVQTELNHLQSQQDQIGAQFDQLQGKLNDAKSHLNAVKKQNAAAYNQYVQARKALQGVAVASYEDSGNSSLVGLVTTQSPDTVLSQASLVQEVANLHNEEATKFLAAANAVQKAEEQVQHTEAGIQQLTDQVKGKRDALNKQVAKEKALLTSLQDKAAAAEAATILASGGGIDQPGQVSDPLGTGTPALEAVKYAYDHIGDPYVWGATGPTTFDCSGLMMAAYEAAGISIPRDTYGQVAALPSIPESDLQPGDLMFFESDNHVGMYVGHDMMIDAPATGQNVTLHSIHEAWYAENFVSAARVPGSGN